MSTPYELLLAAGEPYAAGYAECPDRSVFFRIARAQRRYWENCPLPEYDGGPLYPCGRIASQFDPAGKRTLALIPSFSFTFDCDRDTLREKCPEGAEAVLATLPHVPCELGEHGVGGAGYTHSFANYPRLLKEGLSGYEKRILALEEGDFRDGLLELLEGIRAVCDRSRQLLKAVNAPEKLQKAFEKLPFSPPKTFYEALLDWNLIWYLDRCDDPGRLGEGLLPYFDGEDHTAELRKFFENVDANDGWSIAMGPVPNAVDLQILKACHGLRRPSIEFFVSADTPAEAWEAAAEAIASGGGQPALYNYDLYHDSLLRIFPNIPEEDLRTMNGGGCTEMMLPGISHVGSLDAGINTALVFADYLRENLCSADSFETFYTGLISAVKKTTHETLDKVAAYYAKRAAELPHPVRTLFTDDCIENRLDFNNGGARYNWSVVNFAGMVNVAESLLAIRKLVFEDKAYTPADFLKLLDAEDEALYRACRACPHYGTGDAAADSLAGRFMSDVFSTVRGKAPRSGSAYLPSCIQFATYAQAGLHVPATPDGRKAGDPLCDSMAPLSGNDTKGPTGLLLSAAAPDLTLAPGTPVTNLRLHKDHAKTYVRPLTEAFFRAGGMQLQITCASAEDMRDAMVHPEKHADLVVRIGGYADYFVRLERALQEAVLERTEHCR